LNIDKVFKALADPNRRTLLDQLYLKNGQTLHELVQHLNISRQAVTKHLTILAEANLVIEVRRGREKLHYLNSAPIGEIYNRWISKYSHHRMEVLDDMKYQLEEENNE